MFCAERGRRLKNTLNMDIFSPFVMVLRRDYKGINMLKMKRLMKGRMEKP